MDMIILKILASIYLCSIAFNAIVFKLIKKYQPDEYESVLGDKMFSADFMADVVIFCPVINTIVVLMILYSVLLEDIVTWIYTKYLWFRLLSKLKPETREKIKRLLHEYKNGNQSSDSKATSLEERPPDGENAPSDKHQHD